jgi:hypothetical protein
LKDPRLDDEAHRKVQDHYEAELDRRRQTLDDYLPRPE